LQATAVAGTTTVTLPAATDTLVGKATTDTLTNKTLTAPVISTISNTGTLTLPTSTDTLVGRATTDTLTNKTLTTPVISSLSSASATALTLQSAGTTAITVDTSQRVGIGTTSPVSKLDFGSSAGSSGTAGLPSLSIYSYPAGSERYGFNLGSNSLDISALSSGGRITFYTGGSTSSITERARIDDSGNLLVGTTNPDGKLAIHSTSTTALVGWFSSDTASFTGSHLQTITQTASGTGFNHLICYSNTGGTTNLKIIGNGNVQNANNSYGAISDVKLKENIVDASPKLASLMQVKVRNYNMIGDTTKQIGVVAQELEEIFPAMVEETPDKDVNGNDLGTKTKAVKYSVFVPMLIKAIQELKAINDTQAETINALTARIVALEAK